MAAAPEFVHLHVASAYSLRYGTATPRALAGRAAELGMGALALTDRDGLYGAFKHVRACADAGIRPLLGTDLALLPTGGATPRAPRGAPGGADRAGCLALPTGGAAPRAPRGAPGGADRAGCPARGWPGEAASSAPGGMPGEPGRVTLLAAGRRGWASLCRLVSAAGAGPVTPELIAGHSAGLVLLLGPASDVGQAVAARRQDLARRALARWRHLGVDAVVEIVDHQERKSAVRAARMAELAIETRTPAVLSNAVRYLDPDDSMAAQVLDAARHLLPLGSPRLPPHNGRAYLASPAEMARAAERVAAAMTGPGGGPGGPGGAGGAGAAGRLLAATAELAARCVLDPARDLGVGTHHLPEARGVPGEQQHELRARCEQAILHGRYRTADPGSRPRGTGRRGAAELARDRLEHELSIIAATGMAPYFLTVADVADRIRRAGIRCAIRGSGTGSLVSHLLGISAIDPLEHGLLMERFLSPVRATLPDIDLDVESARRLDAYRIIFDAYGAERTACACLFQTYRARSAIRDAAAAMSLPPDEIGAIARAFPHIRARDITAALADLPELRRSRLGGPHLDAIFRIAQRLDGLPRHIGMHPCGVLLSDATLLDRTPVRESGEGFPLSQLDSDDAETAGVIKLDVLGVRMQSAMAHALAEIRRATGESIDLDAIRRDDAGTYAMIARAQTVGCFQIESPGQRELVRKLAPRDMADLIVDISLFRPGPVNSDMITPFLRVRHGLAEPCYPDEKLRGALAETGGVVVFHEQVLRVIDVMTGCGLAEADLVRRHLSTDGGPARTAPWFRARALARGFSPAAVERVWEVVAAFGGFGFCKAHAAAFAIPVYQSAWLKRHYPAAFYAGLLTHDPGLYPKRVIVADARLAGVGVLGVDVNASAGEWRAAAAAVRCSLREVKGISGAEVERITAGQPYASLRDFWDRAGVSRLVAERLVLVGAFDSLYPPGRVPAPSRRDLLARLGVLARRPARARPEPAGALALFAAGTGDDLAGLAPAGELRDLDAAERVGAELEILGFDLSRHVLDFYAGLLAELSVVRSPDLAGRGHGETVLVAGVKVATQTPAVRSGQRIIFASLDDAAGLVDLAFFESVQDRCAARLFGSWLLVVRGRVRRAGAGPAAVTVSASECWDLQALAEIRAAGGITAVRAAMAAGDVGPAARPAHRRETARGGAGCGGAACGGAGCGAADCGGAACGGAGCGGADCGGAACGGAGCGGAACGGPAGESEAAAVRPRPAVFASGFALSPYAETGTPGSSLKNPPRNLWHASPGSPD